MELCLLAVTRMPFVAKDEIATHSNGIRDCLKQLQDLKYNVNFVLQSQSESANGVTLIHTIWASPKGENVT